jgi:hypothetical protein
MEDSYPDVNPSPPDSIKVLVRVRPLSDKEFDDAGETTVINILSGQSLSVTSLDGKRTFQCGFDAVLGPTSTQVDVYDTVRCCTASTLNGVNSTIFAYGQTGKLRYLHLIPPLGLPTKELQITRWPL